MQYITKHLKNDYHNQMLGNIWGNRCKYLSAHLGDKYDACS